MITEIHISNSYYKHMSGADPGFFPRGGPVGHNVTKTPQASQGKVRRGVWGASPKKILNMKCSRIDSEQISGTSEIFSRAIFLGTLLQFCENSEERVQSQIRNFMVWIFMGSNLSWRRVWGSRKLRNMKCSRSDFIPIEGTLSNWKFYDVNIYG